MAIKLTREGDKVTIELDNGHATALGKITDDYQIQSEQDTLGFMLALLSDAEGKSIVIDGQSFVPSQKIKRDTQNDKNL